MSLEYPLKVNESDSNNFPTQTKRFRPATAYSKTPPSGGRE